MRRQRPAGAVADPQHLIALDGRDEPDVGAGQDHDVGRLPHRIDQPAQVRQGDVPQRGDRRLLHRRPGGRTGPAA